MHPDGRDQDDPTRALDDFIRRSALARSTQDGPPDLSNLMRALHPEQASARPKGGTLKDGTNWAVDDVIDVPVVELRAPPQPPSRLPQLQLPQVDLAAEEAQAHVTPEIDLPSTELPTPPDAASVAQTTGQARDFAAAQWLADARAGQAPAPQPDVQALPGQRRREPRLLARWQPGAWVAASRQAVGATTEVINTPQGPVIETYPAQYLVALWAPAPEAGQPPGRWPQRAWLCAADTDAQGDALGEALLAQLPDPQPLWRLPAADGPVDWALVAEIVLVHEPGLRPFQSQALRALMAREREATFARLNSRYQRPAVGGPVQQLA